MLQILSPKVKMTNNYLEYLYSMIIFIVIVGYTVGHSDGDSDSVTGETYKIEGKVTPPDNPPPDWLSVTTVSLDGGKRRAFLKDDNSFVFQV